MQPPTNYLLSMKLTFGRVLETAIHNSAQKLGLQHEILEVGGVDTNIVTPRIQ